MNFLVECSLECLSFQSGDTQEDQRSCEYEQRELDGKILQGAPQEGQCKNASDVLNRVEDQIFIDYLAIRDIFLQSLVVTPTLEEYRSSINGLVTKKFVVILREI
ncbi:hypothetical protein NPIL_255851 [Nephila pilipes]|uniref:Uncharacterized protein n=1 Tax=Nephila pilipes TaxID=299642 RepID=A0A8X6PVY0_NEPPI|nr:hypothetical protein NPIL_255851 [Nephila pilipes]